MITDRTPMRDLFAHLAHQRILGDEASAIICTLVDFSLELETMHPWSDLTLEVDTLTVRGATLTIDGTCDGNRMHWTVEAL